MFRFSFLLVTCSLLLSSLSHADYETVNGSPQFTQTKDQFGFYWSLWRNLSLKERQNIGKSGSLISQRNIKWNISECNSLKTHSDQESFWYWDPIRFDEEGKIIPIREATRKGYLYLNLLTLGSSRLWGAEPSSPKNSWGELEIEAIHHIYSEYLSVNPKEFLRFPEYVNRSHPLYETMNRYSPYRWPIYYDERAHKLHSLKEPSFWNAELPPITETVIKVKLLWNWCDNDSGLKFKVQVPKGQLFPPGPNRPGRSDSGDSSLQIEEIP